jgi:hypothetical protein
MNNQTKDKFNIEFPKEMTPEERDWIKEYIFKFLERHSCTISKIDNNGK